MCTRTSSLDHPDDPALLDELLLRVFAWKIILGFNGVINSGLMAVGLIDAPLEFSALQPDRGDHHPGARLGRVRHSAHLCLLEKIDRSLLEAATDLGDGPVVRFLRVTLPLSLPGVIAATLMMFIPTVGDYVTPALLGGPDGLMLANIIQVQFGKANNWPLGSALSVSMMVIVATISLSYMWITRKLTEKNRVTSVSYIQRPNRPLYVYAIAYLAFLYIPVLFLPVFSFNDAPLSPFRCAASPPSGTRACSTTGRCTPRCGTVSRSAWRLQYSRPSSVSSGQRR